MKHSATGKPEIELLQIVTVTADVFCQNIDKYSRFVYTDNDDEKVGSFFQNQKKERENFILGAYVWQKIKM